LIITFVARDFGRGLAQAPDVALELLSKIDRSLKFFGARLATFTTQRQLASEPMALVNICALHLVNIDQKKSPTFVDRARGCKAISYGLRDHDQARRSAISLWALARLDQGQESGRAGRDQGDRGMRETKWLITLQSFLSNMMLANRIWVKRCK
jgi:hypothetical protein